MAAETIDMGSRVACRGQHATVKYLGPVNGAAGTWIGVEFDKAPEGTKCHDGTAQGARVFEGKKDLCLFVRPPAVCLSSQAGFASAFSQMQVIESMGEGQLLEKQESSKNLCNMMKDDHKTAQADAAKRASNAENVMEKAAEGVPELDCSAEGKIPDGYPEKLIEFYKNGKNGEVPKIPAQHVLYLVSHSYKFFQRTIPTATYHLKMPENGSVVVCGDTHGQLEDLLWILFKHGNPASDRVYLMNGDIADRGDHAIEIFMVLLAFNLQHPGCVWINKGNHEDNLLNLRYGFDQEIKVKYPKHHRQMYDCFQNLFRNLPLATIIDNQVFVVHGGLTRKPVRLNLLDGLDHRRDVPDAPKGFQDLVYYDSVWSDPQPQNGISPNPRGGDTIQFGPDVTAKFLAINKLSLVIRSHQVPENLDAEGYPRGFGWHHPFPKDNKVKPLWPQQAGMCLTVFSASNYSGNNANMGAVVMFNNGVQNMEILEHYAQDIQYLNESEKETKDATQQIRAMVASREKAAHKKMIASSTGMLKSQLIDEIKSLIVRKKTELFEWFWHIDPEKDLHVSPEIWQEGCASVLSENLKWEEIQDLMMVLDKSSGMINYSQFLSRFHVKFNNKLGLHSGFQRAITDRCYEMLLLSDLSLRETFAVLDRNDDGLVSLREFQEVLADLGTGMNKPQIQALMKTIIQHGCHPGSGGKLKIEEFLARVQTRYSATNRKVVTDDQAWIPGFLGQVTKDAIHVVQRKGLRVEEMVMPSSSPMGYLTEFFHSTDTDRSGFLEPPEFKAALKSLACCKDLKDEQLDQIVAYCDADGNGRLNYLEFLHMFHMEDTTHSSLGEDILDHVNRTIYFDFRIPMQRAFQQYHTEDGRITLAQFEKLLKNVNDLMDPSPLSTEQIQALLDTLSTDDDGKFDYKGFIDSFEIIDEVFDECM
eukprot:TRINITY_DN364_c0_g1_i2.p1 TRINITY_DN364_c0_g1~~TRINITY_DN364_c0_g1_i2.p1  ORF type:complete len:928 (+),score=421.11 TRINITY_DN364_c0_g1_i2:62-2845(+)